eukprot:6186909-Pleurochrysis_carterae.AAC.1
MNRESTRRLKANSAARIGVAGDFPRTHALSPSSLHSLFGEWRLLASVHRDVGVRLRQASHDGDGEGDEESGCACACKWPRLVGERNGEWHGQ